MKKILFIVILLIFISSGMVSAQQELNVVASTAWVGGIAEAAGVTNIRVLAPTELRHPTEYDFRPSDIQLALRADYIIWAGYEPFIRRLVEAANIPEQKVLRVNTNNSPPILRESVRTLAMQLGQEAAMSTWEQKLDALAEQLQSAAKNMCVSEIAVAVQGHQQRFVEWLGYNVVAVYGPGEMTPTQLANVLKENPVMIIDNWHSAQGQPLVTAEKSYHSLLNFPGTEGTRTLLDVIKYNGKQLGLIP